MILLNGEIEVKKGIGGLIWFQKSVGKGHFDVFNNLLLEDQTNDTCLFGGTKWMFTYGNSISL